MTNKKLTFNWELYISKNMAPDSTPPLSSAELQKTLQKESCALETIYRWLEAHMPPRFLNEVTGDVRIIMARALLSFSLQDHFSSIHLKQMAITICLDGPDADLKILKTFAKHP